MPFLMDRLSKLAFPDDPKAHQFASSPDCPFQHSLHQHFHDRHFPVVNETHSPVLVVHPLTLTQLLRLFVLKEGDYVRKVQRLVCMLFKETNFSSDSPATFLAAPLYCTAVVKSPSDLMAKGIDEMAAGTNHWAISLHEVGTDIVCFGEGFGYPDDNVKVLGAMLVFIGNHQRHCFAQKQFVVPDVDSVRRVVEYLDNWDTDDARKQLKVRRLPFPRQDDGHSCGPVIMSYFAMFLKYIAEMVERKQPLAEALPQLLQSPDPLGPYMFANVQEIRANMALELLLIKAGYIDDNPCCSPLFLLPELSPVRTHASVVSQPTSTHSPAVLTTAVAAKVVSTAVVLPSKTTLPNICTAAQLQM